MSLLLLLLAFPGQRIANLPTGVLPESHVWQVNISHRFYPAVLREGWGDDVVGFMAAPDVRDIIDKSLSDRLLVGARLNISARYLGLHAAWAPLGWLTLYPDIGTHLYRVSTESTWANVGICAHRDFGGRYAVVCQPRYTTNTEEHIISLGLGAKAGIGSGMSLGLEAEPVLLGRTDADSLMMLNLAFEKEIGWHNFLVTLGNAYHQNPPDMFRNNVLDIAKGQFRVGFNIMRKF